MSVPEIPAPVHQDHPRPKQFEPLSLVPILAGLYWLLADSGGAWLIWALLPGCALLSSGFALLLMPGDPRITGLMALSSAIGMLLFPVIWFVAGFGVAFLCGLFSFGSYLAAGRAAIIREPSYEGAPPPALDTGMDIKIAMDEAVLGYFVFGARIPAGAQAEQVVEEAQKLEALVHERGWHRDPAPLHPAPAAPEQTWWEKGRSLGHEYDVLRFDSGFEPLAELPSAANWRSERANKTCAARIFRHPGAPRPWLMCLHGYRMGVPMLDLSLFPPGWLHHRLGLNIIQPVLPLHGPRKIGARTGDHFLDGDPLDLLLAEMQTLWDLRRTLAWLRQQEPEARVGVLGYSLGGYNTALLAGYESGLDFAVAGIPAMDFAGLLWRHLPREFVHYFNARGFTLQRYREILKPVSPLARPAAVDKDRLLILGATADRLVPPSQPLLLSRHWGVPVQWYQGSHLSVRNERENREIIKEALLRASWPVR